MNRNPPPKKKPDDLYPNLAEAYPIPSSLFAAFKPEKWWRNKESKTVDKFIYVKERNK